MAARLVRFLSNQICPAGNRAVSLAGIQALNKLVQSQQRLLRAQQRELNGLKAEVAKLQCGGSATSR